MRSLLFAAVFVSSLFSQSVMCYKKDMPSEVTDENIKLEGSRCNGKYSVKDMKNHGWKLKDTKIVQKDSKYTHMYIFSKADRKISIIYNNDTKQSYFNTANKALKIYDVNDETAKIPHPNLVIGQSGMVLNRDNPSDLLVSYATVIDTNDSFSTIKFNDRVILKQDGLPTSKQKPKNEDIFLLNHLYNISLLIVPNSKANTMVKKTFPKQNFLSEDFFAAHLKLEDKPVPSREDIQEFCTKHEIGTLFLVIKNGVFIVDTTSFAVLKSFKLPINDYTTAEPFYTNIAEIEPSIFSTIKKTFDNFIETQEIKVVEEEMSSYNKHYSKLLELY